MDDLHIVDFQPAYADAFLRLNEEWLEKYFWVEDIDRKVLTDPQGEIIDHGGYILFARLGDDIIGTAALKHQGDAIFELTKMAVTATQQGAGVGRALMIASIEQFESAGGKKLYLETNSSLSTAIGLYESAGFIHAVAPAVSEYARADTYMIYPKGSKPLKSKRNPHSKRSGATKPHKCPE